MVGQERSRNRPHRDREEVAQALQEGAGESQLHQYTRGRKCAHILGLRVPYFFKRLVSPQKKKLTPNPFFEMCS